MTEDPSPTQPPSAPAGPTVLKKASRWEVFFPSSGSEPTDAVFIASFPKIIYFWPAMATFLACGLLSRFTSVNPNTLAWWAIGVFAANLLVIVQDFDQKKFIILMLFALALGLGAWIVHLKELTFLQGVTGWLGGLDMVISAHVYLVLASILILLLAWGLVRPIFDYWRLEPNEFVHYIQPFGRDISVPRAGHTVNKEIPDILEFILTLGGGSLVIRDSNQVVARIPDIPVLGMRMKKIEKMLGVTRVTTVRH